MFNRIIKIGVMVVTLSASALYANPIFTTPPGPLLGEPGTTVGWGFSITNDTGFFLLFDSSQFCQIGEDPQFTTCTQTLGTYNDLIATNVTIISPDSTLTQAYNAGAGLGLGTYSISPSATLYTSDVGVIVLTYQEFSGNPLLGGTQVSGDIELGLNDLPGPTSSGAASVEAVPEPSAVPLLMAGLLLGAAAKRRGSSTTRS